MVGPDVASLNAKASNDIKTQYQVVGAVTQTNNPSFNISTLRI